MIDFPSSPTNGQTFTSNNVTYTWVSAKSQWQASANGFYYIGTTANYFGRASGSQSLTGVSIDGSAGSATNLTGAITANVSISNQSSPYTYTVSWGDGTGWTLRYMTSVTGVPTQRFSFTDTGNFTASGSITGGAGSLTTLVTTGTLTSTSTGSATTGASQVYLNGATSNRIDFNTNGVAPPAFTTRSAGTKILYYPAISGSQVDYAVGVDGSTLWNSIPTTGPSMYFKWYAGTNNAMQLTGDGNLSLSGVFIENSNTITSSYTITTGKNAMSVGPLTIANNVTVTVPDGSAWTIV